MRTKTNKRIVIFLISIITFLIISKFLFNALRENTIYFFSPTEVSDLIELPNKKIRIGGMVKEDSIIVSNNEIKFTVTDLKNEIIVSYRGAVPNLFAEGKGVVAEGILKDKKFFVAKRILAKHDENYMPPKEENNLNKNVK